MPNQGGRAQKEFFSSFVVVAGWLPPAPQQQLKASQGEKKHINNTRHTTSPFCVLEVVGRWWVRWAWGRSFIISSKSVVPLESLKVSHSFWFWCSNWRFAALSWNRLNFSSTDSCVHIFYLYLPVSWQISKLKNMKKTQLGNLLWPQTNFFMYSPISNVACFHNSQWVKFIYCTLIMIIIHPFHCIIHFDPFDHSQTVSN